MEGPPRRRGCGAVLFLLVILLACVAIVAVAAYTLVSETNEIRVTVHSSADVVPQGQPFTVTVTVENVELDPVRISAIGLSSDLLDGATVTATEPALAEVESRDWYVLGAWDDYTTNQLVLGGDEMVVTFTLTATQPGSYSGDVTVWVEKDLLGARYERPRHERLEFQVQ